MKNERDLLVARRAAAHLAELAAGRRYDANPTERRLRTYAAAVERSNVIIRALAELDAHPTEEP